MPQWAPHSWRETIPMAQHALFGHHLASDWKCFQKEAETTSQTTLLWLHLFMDSELPDELVFNPVVIWFIHESYSWGVLQGPSIKFLQYGPQVSHQNDCHWSINWVWVWVRVSRSTKQLWKWALRWELENRFWKRHAFTRFRKPLLRLLRWSFYRERRVPCSFLRLQTGSVFLLP